jgi:hypothetical protein
VSGVVTIPAGTLPLPDVRVYVPLRPPAPFGDTVTCEPCLQGADINALTETTTDIDGRFRLFGVPDGPDIPLVIELGQWRRQIVIPRVETCLENRLDASLTHLPRDRTEGDIPRIALTTGGADAMECLLRKIGIRDTEFTLPADPGRVHLYTARGGTSAYAPGFNGGALLPDARSWWQTLDNLLPYDIILHSCEGATHGADKPDAATRALMDYTHAGGRVFLSHFHYIWLSQGPSEFRTVAEWANSSSALQSRQTGFIDRTFERGDQLAQWMEATGSVPGDTFPINEVRGSIQSLNDEIAQRWVWIEPVCEPLFASTFPWLCRDDAELTQYFSFNTPVGERPDSQCGRVVFSDIHVSAGDRPGASNPFPSGCVTTELSPQEKALVFMLFDLSRCIAPDKR